MCGICAYKTKENAVKFAVESLKILEYRGYDSCGISFLKNGEIETIKSLVDIDDLKKKTENLSSNLVIGHTRWATHGGVTLKNAHPHLSSSNKIALVHNGIIENYKTLKENLNCTFQSETDSEVLVNLIESEKGSLIEKVISASKKVEGTFAIAVIENGELVVGKRESPLYVAYFDGGVVATSDISAFVGNVKEFYILNDNEFASLNENKIEFFNENGEKIKKNAEILPKITQNFKIFDKTHMESEIKETKIVLKNTLKEYLNSSVFSDLNLPKNIKEINLIACGTAYHSALMGAEFFKEQGINSHAYVASEFRYGREILNKNALYIFVSQSGETADTIACAKLLKEKKMHLLALTNTPNCVLNRICENVLPTFAGKEFAVASTKAYCCQVFVLFIFSLFLSQKLQDNIEELIKFTNDFQIQDFDKDLLNKISSFQKIFFVGREKDYITALEASLKLKEISYINSIAIPAGELKHGTLALVDENTLVIAISTEKNVREKLLSNLEEIRARGGEVVLVSNFSCKDYIKIPLQAMHENFMPIVSIISLQFFALRMCEKLGYNPDKPKNLAKSVTVE